MQQFPPFIKKLELTGLDTALPQLPPGLTQLTLGNFYNFPDLALPAGLQELTLGDIYNHPISPLPPTLKTLKLGKKFNQPLLQIPNTLTHLQLDQSYIPLLANSTRFFDIKLYQFYLFYFILILLSPLTN
jgi:hypothetical protein